MGINKMALSLAVAGVLGASSALAEQSSAFIGGGFGFHGASRKTNLNLNYNFILTNVNVKVQEEDNAKDTSISLVAGYKNMDKENSGTRVYINYDFNNVKIKEEGEETILSGYHIVGINADLLYNFNPKFGVFVGVNVGAINWGKDIWSLAPEKDSEVWKIYAAGQLGLRWIFGETQKHSVELFAKFPFTETTIVYKTPQDEKVGETKLKQQYNAGFRYVYTF